MQIQYCSITGADDAVNPENLAAISAEFPFVEWAVLLLPARMGEKRFPAKNWILAFSQAMKGLNTALHLCDDGFLKFIDGDAAVLSLMSGFSRIQLNLKFGDVEGKYDPEKLLTQVREHRQWQFIIQYTPDKAGLLPLLKDIPNHAVLFDASAGRGLLPQKWDPPLPGHFCGYAGGLAPDNLEENLRLIEKAAQGHKTWIDMESGVRTADRFDIPKARKVLEITEKFMRKKE